MSQIDTSTLVSALAYPVGVTLLVGLVSLGVLLRGWMHMIQKKQDARLGELQTHQRQLENQICQQGDALAKRVENWSRDVHAQLGGQSQQLRTMNDAVGALKTALVVPHLRGRILGETTLERLLGDVLPPHAYAFQYEIDGCRVDAVIRFPHIGLVCPIDAKFHFDAAQVLLEGHLDSGAMKDARRQLASALKASARDIARKYVRPDVGTTDFAYLFVPSEAVFQEILHDIDLWQSMVDERVLVVSPHTLFVALQPLSHAIRYYEMSAGVNEKIRLLQDAEKQLHQLAEHVNELLTKSARGIEQSQKLLSALPELAHSLRSVKPDPAEHAEEMHVIPRTEYTAVHAL